MSMCAVDAWVLYVDDDVSNLVVFEEGFLGELPILTAKSGAEALELFKTHDIAVLLTDQRMPGMSGVELMETVRRDYPDTTRMLVTAYSDLGAAVEAINRGHVDLYLKKPWEPAELLVALKQARDRRTAARRTRELERRLVETERLYSLGVVAASIAHELRNPLSSLSLNLEFMHDMLREGRTDKALASVQEARKAVSEILAIANSIELSTRSRQSGDVDLREVVELAARSVRAEVRRRGRLELDLVGSVPRVKGSRTRLGQVVLNLLVNALEALDESKATQNMVRVVLRVVDGRIELDVSDTGAGIEAASLPHIFDPFFTTKTEGGTGLGLAISRQIVEEHGGTISVSSERGKGTTFRLSLPPSQ